MAPAAAAGETRRERKHDVRFIGLYVSEQNNSVYCVSDHEELSAVVQLVTFSRRKKIALKPFKSARAHPESKVELAFYSQYLSVELPRRHRRVNLITHTLPRHPSFVGYNRIQRRLAGACQQLFSGQSRDLAKSSARKKKNHRRAKGPF